jgi:hypothetical protein
MIGGISLIKNKFSRKTNLNRRIKMSEYIQFEATNPVVEPAKEAVVYDKFWLSNFRIEAGNPNQKVRLMAAFVPSRDVEVTDPETNEVTVKKELKNGAQPKRLMIADLFEEAGKDPDGLGKALNGILELLKNRAVAEGII